MTKNDTESSKLVNWTGVSRLLTGDPNVIRANNVKVEHRDSVELLLNFIDNWIKVNGKPNAKVTISVPENIGDRKRKKRTTEKFYRVIDEIPEGSRLIDPNLWEKDGLFFTTIYQNGVGFESREWTKKSKARIYLSIKKREIKYGAE